MIKLLPVLWAMSLSNDAFAYLDPGSGSYMIQVAIGLFAGALFAMKQYWGVIKVYWNKFTKKNKD